MCINTIIIPEFETKQEFFEKLLLALNKAEDRFMIGMKE
jgi:hypothetical protein